MTAVLWVLLPILISLGSALLAVWIWQRRLELQLARERQALTEARTTIEAQKDGPAAGRSCPAPVLG